MTPTTELPLLFPVGHRSGISAWTGHFGFAQQLVRALQPRVFIELGVHKGDSYFCFVEALRRFSGNGTVAYGVDTWEGDEHAGFYDDSVYDEVSAINEQYTGFSTLTRCSFDEAERKLHGEIDLLHIDGLHTYEAVSHDFRLWEPHVRDVILLHDINVPVESFGVWRLWNELKVEYPGRTFEFSHCNGLAVLAKSERGLSAVRAIQGAYGSPCAC
jgi:hypothetical protein